MGLLRAIPADSLEPDAVRQFEIAGREPIAIYRLGDDFFATDDLCTHGAASLSEGDIEGDDIICPFHDGSFNIRTGQVTGAPCVTPVASYPVSTGADGFLYVEMPEL